jgi:hypothetical protein
MGLRLKRVLVLEATFLLLVHESKGELVLPPSVLLGFPRQVFSATCIERELPARDTTPLVLLLKFRYVIANRLEFNADHKQAKADKFLEAFNGDDDKK